MKASVEHKILAGFIASVVALAVIGWLAYRTTYRLIETDRLVAHTQEVIATLGSGLAILTDAEAKQRAFLLTGDEQFLKDSQSAQAQTLAWVETVRKLTSDNPVQQRRLAELAAVIKQRMVVLNGRIKLRQEGGLQAVAGDVATLRQGRDLMDQIWRDIAEMRDTEKSLLSQRQQMAQTSAQTSLTVIITGSALTCVIGLTAVLLIHRDLRLRELAEKEVQATRTMLESILNNSPAVIFLKDGEGRYLFVNRRFAQIVGSSPDQIVGKTGFDLFTKEIAQAAREHDLKVLQSEGPLEFEETVQYANGPHTHLAVKFPLRGLPGETTAVCGISTDITERKRAQAQIIQLNADLQNRATQLEMANQELEAFSYSVSHDLRAPLRHIDGFVKLLHKQASEKLEERGRRYLDIIADSARQMGMLIDDLLIFSRMSRTELRHARVSLDALVHEAIHGLHGEIHDRSIRWTIATLPEVEADPAMLRQVWVNLIANAVKYSRPRNPAEIEIGCHSDNGELVFFVRDNGVGFDMQYAHKLFGVFQRLHRAEEFEGTGIGLANVRRIIHRHGGRTWAEGKIDGGATFFFSLPRTPTETKG